MNNSLPISTSHMIPNLGPHGLVVTLICRTKSSSPDPVASSDCLYGFYISSLCLNTFLTIVSSLLGHESPQIAHRFLDNPKHPRVVEITFSKCSNHKRQTPYSLSTDSLIHKFEREWNIDVIFQMETVFRHYPRLVCFDMDSTLIQEEVIDIIAASIGVEAEVSAITERAMNGELDFLSSLRSRVKLLKGIEEDIFIRLRDVITPTKGAKELVRALKRIGVRTAIFSGGFLPTASWLAAELGIDYVYANILSVSDGRFTGELEGEVVNAERKRTLLCELAEKECIALNQTIAVGDGANDLLMLGAAGLGVAWNAKPLVQMQAQAKLNSESLLDLLYFFGFTAEEISLLVS